MNKLTLGVIVGNRDFFPDALVSEARADITQVLGGLGYQAILLDEEDTKLGGVETWQDANKCATLFKSRQDEIDGILIVLPNFGDEKGVADTLKLSGLQVPILVQAYPDDLDSLAVEMRRDAFCGKISVCNNLTQFGYPFSITRQHTVHPKSESFREDLIAFASVCRVVNGLRRARLGAIGARPNAFNTTRYSEKLLQLAGISTSTIDLSEILGEANRLSDADSRVREKTQALQNYVGTQGVPSEALVKMARLGVAIDGWLDENSLDACAIQCWNSLQQNYGVNVCVLMSMLSERLLPSACEVDVAGAVSMYALQLASGTPSALVDWNNNYGDDTNKCVLFHCGNWAKSFYESARMANAEILATTLGTENTYGTMAGRIPAGPVSIARVSTDDARGAIRAYLAEGEFTDDPLNTFGSRAVVNIPNLQGLMQVICKRGFEHHMAISASHVASVLAEAFETYLGWEVYHHVG